MGRYKNHRDCPDVIELLGGRKTPPVQVWTWTKRDLAALRRAIVILRHAVEEAGDPDDPTSLAYEIRRAENALRDLVADAPH